MNDNNGNNLNDLYRRIIGSIVQTGTIRVIENAEGTPPTQQSEETSSTTSQSSEISNSGLTSPLFGDVTPPVLRDYVSMVQVTVISREQSEGRFSEAIVDILAHLSMALRPYQQTHEVTNYPRIEGPKPVTFLSDDDCHTTMIVASESHLLPDRPSEEGDLSSSSSKEPDPTRGERLAKESSVMCLVPQAENNEQDVTEETINQNTRRRKSILSKLKTLFRFRKKKM